VDPLDKWTETSLHDAARWGHLSVVKLLVERGADVRVKDDFGQTASDVVRSEGREDVAEWLVSIRFHAFQFGVLPVVSGTTPCI